MAMKRFALALALLGLLTGCVYYQKQGLPQNVFDADDLESAALTVKQQVQQTKYGFRLFTIPIIVPDSVVMTDDLIARHNAKGLTNVEVEFSEFNAVTMGAMTNPAGFVLGMLFQIPKVKVTGALVYGPDAKP